LHSLSRAIELYGDKKLFDKIVSNNMKLDFSWDRSAQEYQKIYQEIAN
jgi:starch synthase